MKIVILMILAPLTSFASSDVIRCGAGTTGMELQQAADGSYVMTQHYGPNSSEVVSNNMTPSFELKDGVCKMSFYDPVKKFEVFTKFDENGKMSGSTFTSDSTIGAKILTFGLFKKERLSASCFIPPESPLKGTTSSNCGLNSPIAVAKTEKLEKDFIKPPADTDKKKVELSCGENLDTLSMSYLNIKGGFDKIRENSDTPKEFGFSEGLCRTLDPKGNTSELIYTVEWNGKTLSIPMTIDEFKRIRRGEAETIQGVYQNKTLWECKISPKFGEQIKIIDGNCKEAEVQASSRFTMLQEIAGSPNTRSTPKGVH